jgi:ATP-dependent RNA helicase RhlE
MLQLLAGKSTASHSPARHPVRCLVLVPTRELAAQVQESVRTYGKHMKLRTAVIYGGVGFAPQVQELRRGVDIVVATPGRLLDHVGQKTIDLRYVEILVLDEADRMLDMGFIHDIRRILAILPSRRQNLLFSATFPNEVRTLAAGFMHDPVTVEVARRNMPIELIGQVVHPVDKDRKRELLAHLVKTGNWQQVLVFCRTKHGANRLAEQLEDDGIETAAIHGNKSQPQRMKALQRFKDCELQVLVATDIAARGIDIESLPHVVNYDLPHVSEDYVHRIGRTGRAGETGQAVSLVSGEDRSYLRDIERLIGKQIEQQIIPGFEVGSGYHSARPEPQGRRGQQRQSQPRGGQRNAQRSQGNGQRAQGNGQQRSNGQQRHSASQGNGQRNQGNGQRNQSSGQRNQGNGQGRSFPSGRGRDRNDQVRSGRPPQRQAAPALPQEKVQQSVRQEQLEYHRHQQQADEHREAAPANERAKEKAVPALFGLVGRKVA